MGNNKSVSNLSSMDEMSPVKLVPKRAFSFIRRDMGFEDFEKYQTANLGQKLHEYLSRTDISKQERADIEAVIIKYIEFLEVKNVELTNN